MTNFKTKIRNLSKEKGKIILALDFPYSKNLFSNSFKNLNQLYPDLLGIKLNFHLLLPLGFSEIKKITKLAKDKGLITIADIKLNDIANTNKIAIQNLYAMNFDAVIVNPIMGPENLNEIISYSHSIGKGIITLCHMSSPHAKFSYNLNVLDKNKKSIPLYRLFLKWAMKTKPDGIIVGATYPHIIKYCKQKIKDNFDIYSPGVGTQGGKILPTISAGTDYLIVGRTILNSKNSKQILKKLKNFSLLQ